MINRHRLAIFSSQRRVFLLFIIDRAAFLFREKGILIRSLCCTCVYFILRVSILRAFISGRLENIELKFKPTQYLDQRPQDFLQKKRISAFT